MGAATADVDAAADDVAAETAGFDGREGSDDRLELVAEESGGCRERDRQC